MWENWIALVKVKVIMKVKSVNECMSEWYLVKHQTFCNQTWYTDASSQAGMLCKKIGLHIFRVKVTARSYMIIYNSFYSIFWTVDSFASRHGLMVNHHKLECPREKTRLLPSRSRSQWRFKMSMNVCQDSICIVNHWTFYNQTWCGDASSWVRVWCEKIDLLSSRQPWCNP